MDSIITQADESGAQEELDVHADICIEMKITSETLGNMTGTHFEDHLTPVRDRAQHELDQAQKVKIAADKALIALARATVAAAMKSGKVAGTKEFTALAKAFDAANAARGNSTRYEVHLAGSNDEDADPDYDADKKVIRGTLQVRDKIQKSNYRGAYHDIVVDMPASIPFTPEMKQAVKDLDAACEVVMTKRESLDYVTKLIAQRQKIEKRAQAYIDNAIMAGQKPTRSLILTACNNAMEKAIKPIADMLPAGTVRSMLLLEAPKKKTPAKRKAKSKK